MRTGPVARVMPNPSNHSRTVAVERRVRIERARTGSSADASSSASLSYTPNAISSKSRLSRVAGTPRRPEISSTRSW
ncbi:hypothetical protein a10_09123 [Streptomyces acidiscabies]|nr:hypothetical protein a10_09123 [Streptomyces acidiscabies]